MADLVTRLLIASDADAATTFVHEVLAGTAYDARAAEVAALAARADPEWRGVGAFHGNSLVALACLGPVTGARDAWRLHVLLFSASVLGAEVADALIAVACDTAARERARFLVAELPADEVIGFSLTSLRRNGFRQEARVPDLFDDEVALLFLRRDDLRAR